MEILSIICYIIKYAIYGLGGIKLESTKTTISNGVEIIIVNAKHFKTNEISISFATPLNNETVAENAVVSQLLARKSSAYDTSLKLNKKLASLYGATVVPQVSKIGEAQVIKLNLSCLDDRFSLDNSSISMEAAKLLCDIAFSPRLNSDGLFYDEDVQAEKRIITQKIEAEENEKRTYVLRKAEEIMFKNEPYSLSKYGTKQQVNQVNALSATKAWNRLVVSSKITITVVGSVDNNELLSYVENYVRKTERDYLPLPRPVFVPSCDNPRQVMERLDVKQGKLVLGFRVNMEYDDDLTSAMRCFCDVFGGGPYSKLFANVREKMSLCYYCSARYTRQKSFIMVQCGCNEENMDKAVCEILNQLEIIKNGDFDEEFASSKISINDSLKSLLDAPDILGAWYSNNIYSTELETPEMHIEKNNAVTKEQVQKCASLLTLDTVYKLSSPKEEE